MGYTVDDLIRLRGKLRDMGAEISVIVYVPGTHDGIEDGVDVTRDKYSVGDVEYATAVPFVDEHALQGSPVADGLRQVALDEWASK